MSFTVLTDNDVKQILSTLSQEDVSNLVQSLQDALVQYSTGDEQQYQPHRAVVKRPNEQVSLFMPGTTKSLLGVKIVGIAPSNPTPKPAAGGPVAGLKSVLTLCDETGQAIGVLNAAALTAFRTSLGSMLLYRFRKNTKNIVVFGAGKQAQWHVSLALLLRDGDISKVTLVNRSAERTKQLVESLTTDPHLKWPEHVSLEIFSPAPENRDAELEALVVDADVIFCTTPSTTPLWPASYLTSEKARAKTRYIGAIGSYRLDMQEIDPELLKEIVNPSGVFSDVNYQDGIVTVDTRVGCLDEAGELVKANIDPKKMYEVGTLFNDKAAGETKKLDEWLENGFVIYKSVGVGIMDLAIGQDLLRLSKARKVGLTAEEF